MKGIRKGYVEIHRSEVSADKSYFGDTLQCIYENGGDITYKFRATEQSDKMYDNLMVNYSAEALLIVSECLVDISVEDRSIESCKKVYDSLGELTKVSALQWGWSDTEVREQVGEHIEYLLKIGDLKYAN